MADAQLFDWACNRLEQETSFSRLEARGTMRLALREAGLETHTVTPEQMAIVFEKLLPTELASRAIDGAAELCRQIAVDARTQHAPEPDDPDSPESIFSRLGR